MKNIFTVIMKDGVIRLDNIHKDCENYVEDNDMCLEYYLLGYHRVSQYPECLKEVIWSE